MQTYEDNTIQKTGRYLANAETMLKKTRNNNKALIEYFTTLKEAQNTAANAIRTANTRLIVI